MMLGTCAAWLLDKQTVFTYDPAHEKAEAITRTKATCVANARAPRRRSEDAAVLQFRLRSVCGGHIREKNRFGLVAHLRCGDADFR